MVDVVGAQCSARGLVCSSCLQQTGQVGILIAVLHEKKLWLHDVVELPSVRQLISCRAGVFVGSFSL